MILFVPSVLGAFLHSGISILAKASLPAYAMIILGILSCYMHYLATGFSHLQLYRIRPIVCIGLLQFNAVHSPGHLLLLDTQYCSFHECAISLLMRRILSTYWFNVNVQFT
jgi:hypothetical protein